MYQLVTTDRRNEQRPLPSLSTLDSLGTSGPFVVRGVPVLAFFNLDEVLLRKERFNEVRVPTP